MPAAAAVTNLAASEPPINFAAHQFRAGNISGAREDFEQMLALLVAATYPGARLIAANPGDWGIDVLVGELSGLVAIWQAKYFWPAVTKSRQANIRESFASAVASASSRSKPWPRQRQLAIVRPLALPKETRIDTLEWHIARRIWRTDGHHRAYDASRRVSA